MAPASAIAMTPLELVLSRLHSVRRVSSGRWRTACPGPNHPHGDRNPSLSIREAANGTALLHCFAGCTLDEILMVIGLSARDLFPEGTDGRRIGRRVGSSRQARPHSPLDEARAVVLSEARHQPWARPFVRSLYSGADWVRAHLQWIQRVRRAVTEAGSGSMDNDAAVDLLAAAADEERRVRTVEALLDELAQLLPALTDVDVPDQSTNTITVEVL